MREATAACHPERSEAESKDPAKSVNRFNQGLKAWLGLRRCIAASTSLGMTALNIRRSALSVAMFRLYSRVEDVACPITDIDRSPPGCFTAG